MSEMPMFDDVIPETQAPAEQPPKRKPRKPMKRTKRELKLVTTKPVRRKPMKRGRGRPPGALNKPKPAEQHAGGRFTKAQYQLIGYLLEMAPQDRAAVLEVVAGLAK